MRRVRREPRGAGNLVYAVDPGPERSAFVTALAGGGPPLRHATLCNTELLGLLAQAPVRTGVLVVEMVSSYGMAVGADVFETCVWIGRFLQVWRGGEAVRVFRHEVKMELCQHPRANDASIRQALIDRYGGETRATKGARCPTCKGKGWRGRGRPTCTACEGSGWEVEPGPLRDLVGDQWAALAVAETYRELIARDEEPKLQSKGSSS